MSAPTTAHPTAPNGEELRGRWEQPRRPGAGPAHGQVLGKGFDCSLCKAGTLHTSGEHALMIRAATLAKPTPARRRPS
jgi:hypothetical protein